MTTPAPTYLCSWAQPYWYQLWFFTTALSLDHIVVMLLLRVFVVPVEESLVSQLRTKSVSLWCTIKDSKPTCMFEYIVY